MMPAFSRGDESDGVAEIGHVIVGDARDGDHAWRRDHVRGVQPTAEADLEVRTGFLKIDLGLFEGQKCASK